jgi:hypothetical protein
LYGKKEGKSGIESVTRNQRLVLVWFEDHCSLRGIVKVSNSEIGLIFGWSQPYAKRILKNLTDSGNLEILQKGIGRRPTKYQVTSISHNQIDLAITSSKSSGGTPQNVAHYVPSGNQNGSLERQQAAFKKELVPFRLYSTPRKNKEKENAYRSTHIRNGTVFDTVPSLLKAVKTASSPFKRFKTHCDNVDQWNGPDFVCYFSFVYRVRFGETPELNWPMEVGAARILLSRLEERWKFKVFIQTAFLFAKRKPNGLRTFTNDYKFREIISQRYTEDQLDEYHDECVFPWLWEKVKREGIAASVEYNARLTRRAFGIYD